MPTVVPPRLFVPYRRICIGRPSNRESGTHRKSATLAISVSVSVRVSNTVQRYVTGPPPGSVTTPVKCSDIPDIIPTVVGEVTVTNGGAVGAGSAKFTETVAVATWP